MEPAGKQVENKATLEGIKLSNLQLGPLIAKGSNSAVYSACLCSDQSGIYNTSFNFLIRA